MELFHPDGYSFRNMDLDGTYTVPIKKIYLEIIPAKFDEATIWDVALGCRPRF